MGLFYTFKADGEEKLLSTYVADPSDRYALQWLYEDFRLVDRQPFPMLMDVQVLKNGNPEGGVKNPLLPYPTGRAAQVGFFGSF